MPVAIRMANGATYYSGGFNHANELYYPNGFEHAVFGAKKGISAGSTKADEAYALRMQAQGYVPNTTSVRPDWKWVTPATLKSLQVAEAGLNTANAVKKEGQTIATAYKAGANAYDLKKSKEGKEGNALGRAAAGISTAASRTAVGRAARNEAKNIKTSAFEEQNKYVSEHTGKNGVYNGSRLGYGFATAKGALKGTSAYKAGAAAVGKAAEMLGDAKEWAGKKFDSAKKWAGGKFDDAKKWAGGKFDNAKEWAGTKFTNIKDTVNGAAGTAWEGIKGASGRVAKDFKNVAKAIGDTAVGQAALKAGKAALDAGGSVVGAVGGALSGIVEFFGTKIRTYKNKKKNGTTYDEPIGAQPEDKKK